MPQIVIKEYDTTKAGSSAENGFGVVVPGYLGEGKTTACFDENYIYECSSVADFDANIGKAEDSEATAAVAPTLTLINDSASSEDAKYYNVLTASVFFAKLATGEVYKRTEVDAPSDGREGYLLKKLDFGTTAVPDIHWFKYTKATSEDWKDVTYSEASVFNSANAYVVGDYVTYNNQLYICIKAKAAEAEFSSENFEATPKFSIIASGAEGVNYSEGVKQIGNQIARLLLSLGYKVFYLLLNDERLITDSTIWAPLKDKSAYSEVRYIIGGLLDNASESITVNAVNEIIRGIACENTGRADCFALLDIAKSVYSDKTSAEAVNAIKAAMPTADKYSAIFAPTVIYSNIGDGYNNKEFPASIHYLVCAANAFDRYPEWFAVSGYQRGVCNLGLGFAGPTVNFGDAAVQALQPRTNESGVEKAVNLVIKLGNAYYLWGNRTGYPLSSELVASHFLNIRQLCCTLKKVIYSTCKNLMFDPNSDILWLNFCNAIRPTLEKMKANQGIKDYRFEKKETSKKGKLFAAIRIIPIEAVEDFEIGITLEDSFDQTTVVIDETL